MQDNNKLEAWTLIGRLASQVGDWNQACTPELIVKAMQAHGVPPQAIKAIRCAPGTENRNGTKKYRLFISERAVRVARALFRELEDFPNMTVLEAMQFAQETKQEIGH